MPSLFPESDDQLPKLHLSAKLGKPSGSVCTYESVDTIYAGRHIGVLHTCRKYCIVTGVGCALTCRRLSVITKFEDELRSY